MKKLIGIITVAVLVSVAVLGVNAQDNAPAKKQGTNINNVGPNYVDKDNDGKCDNKDSRNKQRMNRNYVDNNNDGKCDNQGKNCKKQNGKKKGRGNCKGNNGGNGRK